MVKKLLLTILIFVLFVSSFLIYKNNKTVDELGNIKNRGVLIVGTTGDYQPMSFYDKQTSSYEGFDIALAEDLAKALNVKLKFVPTTWPTLMEDTLSKKFDIAISGISITEDRKKQALMSDGYLENGKTVLCRTEDKNKYISIDSINKKDVKIMENPGGLNEKFARENCPKAKISIHSVNEEIPNLIAEGKADVMITEVAEAKYYSSKDKRLSAPLINYPFTNGQIGILIPKENETLLRYVNKFLHKERKSGRIKELTDIYIYGK